MDRKKILTDLKKQIIEESQDNPLTRAGVFGEVKTLLGAKGKSGDTYIHAFLKKYLEQAYHDPRSRAAQQLAGVIFQENLLQMVDEQHEKEMAADQDFQRYRILKTLFKEQRDVVMETNHAKRLIGCCSRRAGKTDLSTAAINHAAIIPNSRIIYVNLTFTNAINQIWAKVLERSESAGLSIVQSSKSAGTIEWSNGSSLRVMGNPNNSEIEKLRGESKVSLIVIDEFFHQKNLTYALNEVISPLMTDRADSTLLCIGTPPRLAHTDGEKFWNEKGWKRFQWTMFENPYIPDPEEYLQDYCKNKGITIDAPFIQREYFGKIGVYDTEALVFNNRKTFKKLESTFKPTDISIGVDYGFQDDTAIITIEYDKRTKESRITREDCFNRSGVSTIIDKIVEHYNEAKKKIKNKDKITIWADTNEEAITFDLINKYQLPAFNCYKYDKTYAIELLAEELRTGRMKIPAGGVLDKEMEKILYKRDAETDSIISELDEEQGIHPNAMFALLYASRKVFYDFDYDIKFKATKPKTSNYTHDERGNITGVNEVEEQFTDGGVIG